MRVSSKLEGYGQEGVFCQKGPRNKNILRSREAIPGRMFELG